MYHKLRRNVNLKRLHHIGALNFHGNCENSLAQLRACMAFVFYRKNQQRALDTIQISLEAEARGRLEALRQRKKLEQDVLELEAALEATARARGEVEKNYKRFQQQIRDLELVVEEEQAAAQVTPLLT